MNIGIFTDCYLPTKNGVSTAIFQTRQELARRGHRVIVLTVAYSENDSASDESVYRFPSLLLRPDIEIRLGVARQAAIDRIVACEKIEIIHTHTEFSLGWAGQHAARRAGLPLIHTLHTLYPAYRHYLPLGGLLPERAIGRILVRFLREYDFVICPSGKGRDYLAACAGSGAPEPRMVVIGNGVSRERFSPDRVSASARGRTRGALGIGPEDTVILYVGRLAHEKRVLALLMALLPLLRAHAGCRAVFVGAGPMKAELAAAAHSAGVDRQVLLVGPVGWERLAEIYAIAHAFATLSLSEIHPMTLIEAVACGLPIVARRDASISDLVFDGFNGFLVDSDGEIAGKLAAILHHEATRRVFVENARALAPRFAIESHVDRLEALYRQAIQTHSRKVPQ